MERPGRQRDTGPLPTPRRDTGGKERPGVRERPGGADGTRGAGSGQGADGTRGAGSGNRRLSAPPATRPFVVIDRRVVSGRDETWASTVASNEQKEHLQYDKTGRDDKMSVLPAAVGVVREQKTDIGRSNFSSAAAGGAPFGRVRHSYSEAEAQIDTVGLQATELQVLHSDEGQHRPGHQSRQDPQNDAHHVVVADPHHRTDVVDLPVDGDL
ncbi:hypothetical protein EYF80_022462 [Liparis tanakae]|uniref:Uncharacterized protein n=1 Tax=Liparis tanakae TaxID=230148 RepID=A0A4Z2HQ27_9TELE|nr:hypothetical protein EYF80_022462 [Liparis tanakae]